MSKCRCNQPALQGWCCRKERAAFSSSCSRARKSSSHALDSPRILMGIPWGTEGQGHPPPSKVHSSISLLLRLLKRRLFLSLNSQLFAVLSSEASVWGRSAVSRQRAHGSPGVMALALGGHQKEACRKPGSLSFNSFKQALLTWGGS